MKEDWIKVLRLRPYLSKSKLCETRNRNHADLQCFLSLFFELFAAKKAVFSLRSNRDLLVRLAFIQGEAFGPALVPIDQLRMIQAHQP